MRSSGLGSSRIEKQVTRRHFYKNKIGRQVHSVGFYYFQKLKDCRIPRRITERCCHEILRSWWMWIFLFLSLGIFNLFFEDSRNDFANCVPFISVHRCCGLLLRFITWFHYISIFSVPGFSMKLAFFNVPILKLWENYFWEINLRFGEFT